ncbi:hypothetical protein GII33_06450 [Gordonia pseudamarae]|jgi:hypothetical protein|uniref:Uncharacterized protein n=1 Tax=Gordonia pseudamarae TaxID=2831662 RepID=A0ABX6IH16_9ACTN|nr:MULTISPECIES: hypothetical protein [Gordonia]MBD0020501.1 hypothetical protein [Gordonia sp. (in: high G+C Gram-positive bacteria)]QHN25656.1 hypothetical protein GII33_06450 [Gordonia pseudamarae]QHN34588.1 hypothetical protein GII31_06430 [Gordonia pseudamarae]
MADSVANKVDEPTSDESKEFEGLARFWLPPEMVDLRETAVLGGYDIEVRNRCLDDGTPCCTMLVHSVDADGNDRDDFVCFTTDYVGGEWVVPRGGTGTLPNLLSGKGIAVQSVPVRELLRRIGTHTNPWDVAVSDDPVRCATAQDEYLRIFSYGTYDEMVGANAEHLARASQSEDFRALYTVGILCGHDVIIRNSRVEDTLETGVRVQLVDRDGAPEGTPVDAVSVYHDGEWKLDPERVGLLNEADGTLEPTPVEDLLDFMVSQVNDWDFADETLVEEDGPALTERQRRTMRATLAEAGNLDVADLRAVILTLSVYQPVTDRYEGRDYRTVWYSSQREHIAGWLAEYSGPGAYNRRTGSGSSKAFYGRFKCAPGLLWLAEALGEDPAICDRAITAADAAGSNVASQCGAFRKIVPWSRIVELLDRTLAIGGSTT